MLHWCVPNSYRFAFLKMCSYLNIFILNKRTACEISWSIISTSDVSEGSEEELIPCNDSEVEHNVLHDDSDTSASSDAESEKDENYIQEHYITSRDGTEWSKVPHKSKGRTLKRNKLR